MNVVYRTIIRSGGALIMPDGRVINTYKRPIIIQPRRPQALRMGSGVVIIPDSNLGGTIINRNPPDRVNEDQLTFAGQDIVFA